MDFSNGSTDSSEADITEPVTSTNQSDEEEDQAGGFIFNNRLESDGTSKDGTEQLVEREQERVVDLVRLQPTKNGELQDKWDLASGSESTST